MTAVAPSQSFRHSSCLALHREPYRYDNVARPSRVHKTLSKRVARPQTFYTSLSSWDPDGEDGVSLAADVNIDLPSDRAPSKPRLERQEAFHEPKTWQYSDVVEDDADLYKMGLLYDDEYRRGSGFNLDTIVHPEPIYSIRPAKQARKGRQDTSYPYLDLDLSYASLSSDLDVQQYMAPDVHEIPAPVEDDSPTQERRRAGNAQKQSYRDAALSIIPELPESSAHLFGTPAPEATDFPDLITDSEGEDEEGDCADDWALLEEADVRSAADADVDTNAASTTGDEAWIVLGDGS
ncbi:hypothetical protein F4819DRAFT_194213 [Hypoxylon fuscum]|nr:hypothetical protein F4819DRAFT_194213 [Hypoxylon fuscum]